MRGYDLSTSLLVVTVAIVGVMGCTEYETGYYKGRVNEATQEVVTRRYGMPHDKQEMEDGRSGLISTGEAEPAGTRDTHDRVTAGRTC